MNLGTVLIPAGTYTVSATSVGGCISTPSAPIVITDTCPDDSSVVWPGDADANHIVNNLDLLAIGLAYDSSGPGRIVQGIVWQADTASDWADTLPGYSPQVNFKNADCNGDGIVNANDTLAVTANYGLTHAKSANLPGPWRSGTPGLTVQMTQDTLYNGSTFTANVILGTAAIPVSNIYGLAFSINYDPLVTSTASLAFGDSWLGSSANSIHIAVNDLAYGRMEAAITGIDHAARSGNGQIATLTGEITTANITGNYTNVMYISGITAIDQHGNAVPLNAGIDSNYIYSTTGIRALSGPATLSLVPNPANTQVRVSADAAISQITIMDMLGKKVQTTAVNGKNSELIDISALAEGVYVVHVSAAGATATAKLVVSR